METEGEAQLVNCCLICISCFHRKKEKRPAAGLLIVFQLQTLWNNTLACKAIKLYTLLYVICPEMVMVMQGLRDERCRKHQQLMSHMWLTLHRNTSASRCRLYKPSTSLCTAPFTDTQLRKSLLGLLLRSCRPTQKYFMGLVI